MGNLHNVRRACEHVGLDAVITSSPREVVGAPGVILPGIGAMPDAMRTLAATGLDNALREVAANGTPLFGICLGMQLLMHDGYEFAHHEGLGIIDGSVLRLDERSSNGRRLRIPHVGWNAVRSTSSWAGTPLAGVEDGEYMYFVHSYHVVPANPTDTVAVSTYGDVEYCSAIAAKNVFGCQFHPERSGPAGLCMYREFALMVGGATVDPISLRSTSA